MRSNLFSHRHPSSPSHSESTTTSYSSSSSNPTRHTFSDELMEENIENAEAIISQFEVQGTTTHSTFPSLFRDSHKQANQLLAAIQDLKQTMHYLIKHDSSSESLVRAQNLMDMAMKRLEKEFHSILSRHRDILDPEEGFTSPRTSVSDEEEQGHVNQINSTLDDLKVIADSMFASGYSKECIIIYKLVRKSIIDETLYNLGVLDKLPTPSQIQKLEWDSIEFKIKNWLKGIKIAIKKIFLGERILCDYVFSSSEKMVESIFVEVAKDRALALFSFPELVSKYKKFSSEKMFRVLDLYEGISSLWSEIEVIFSFESFSAVRSKAVTSLVKLGEAVRFMLSEFESAVQKESSKAVPGGGIHPLTRYVMNYLVFMADYKDSLEDIVADWPLMVKSPLPDTYFSSRASSVDDGFDGVESPLAEKAAWLILVLLCKLDAKAEVYKDVALSYLFLANNLNYVVTKIRNSDLGPILGPEWIANNAAKVTQYLSNYERMGWSKVISAFPDTNPTDEMSEEYVKGCFSKFNSGFEQLYRIQSSWVIPDQMMQEQVKHSLATKIVPAYRQFYEYYRGTFRRGIGQDSIVKFAPEDLGNYISDLFVENGGTSGTAK